MDTDLTIQRLLEGNPLREPVLRSIIQALHLAPGSRGLDVGCGIGLPALLLAEAVGSQGQIIGVDVLPEMLEFGEQLVAKANFTGRVTFRQGDMVHLPFDQDSFDWAWSADCAGYPAGEFSPILQELRRVVRPGGEITLLAWTSQQVLPGHALLEARLNAACSAYIPFLEDKLPEQHFLRAPAAFHNAGLLEVKVQTFTGEVLGPLSAGERTALVSLFEMLWPPPQSASSYADWQELQRLCQPGSPDFILDIPGYYAFFTCTAIRGKVPKEKP